MEQNPRTSHVVDPATAAGEVSLRFDRWFASHELDLPPPTRAEFVQMGMDALQRWPDRSTGDVLDELIAELDGRLAVIAAEQAHDAGRGDATVASERQPRGLARLFGWNRDRRH
ncbi:hypothetical protein [Cognatilysobacter lacus]|uniref:Uncharacterized protein n=1 Tax=Cognatilysobacter lacus TaxID=1643323 RepID=A0A5D8Z750_9GAMM|nr:hypothetical protein [Lysobacter lacus]TZF89903.1 hypothetical protein FW784_07435 [Lysobacter lacus]